MSFWFNLRLSVLHLQLVPFTSRVTYVQWYDYDDVLQMTSTWLPHCFVSLCVRVNAENRTLPKMKDIFSFDTILIFQHNCNVVEPRGSTNRNNLW